jgi:cold shock CspA family protein
MRGRVKWFSTERGYGFVTDEHASDYYFAVRDVVGSKLPRSDDEIEFSPERTERGLHATNIRIAKENPAQADEREICAHCGKKIVPRLIVYQGEVRRSVCPFCGGTHRRFAIPRLVLVVLVLVAFAVLGKC